MSIANTSQSFINNINYLYSNDLNYLFYYETYLEEPNIEKMISILYSNIYPWYQLRTDAANSLPVVFKDMLS